MSDHPTLLTPEGLPFTVGVASYYDSAKPGERSEPRLYIRIALTDLGIEAVAMTDTGAPWCILEARLAEIIKGHLEQLPGKAIISTRLGLFEGMLYLGTVTLLAERGEAYSVETTFFLSPDWPGGNFVGYQGFLDRFRFAFDPNESEFHFGPLG